MYTIYEGNFFLFSKAQASLLPLGLPLPTGSLASSILKNEMPHSRRLPTRYHTELPQHIKTPTQLQVGSLKPIKRIVCKAERGYIVTTIVRGVVARINRNPETNVSHAAAPAPSIINQKK